MAEEIQIQGSSYVGKKREPLGIIGLAVITLGIYSLVWYFKTNKELAELGQARGTEECGTNPTNSLLAYFPGGIVVIPALVSAFNFTKRQSAASRLTGAEEAMGGSTVFVLWIVGYLFFPTAIVAAYFMQQNLNNILDAQGRGGAQIPAGQAAAAPPAPETPAAAEQPPAPPQN